jgi:hypothetical protein
LRLSIGGRSAATINLGSPVPTNTEVLPVKI